MSRATAVAGGSGRGSVDRGTLVRDGLELLIVVALGGMLASALRRLLRGQVPVHRCPACDRPTTRANPRCRHCGAALEPGP